MGIGAATFNNYGTFDFQSDASLVNASSPNPPATTFNNSGTLMKSSDAGISSIDWSFNNTGGGVDVESGTLSVTGAFSISAGSTLAKSGVGTLALSGPQNNGAGSTIAIGGGTLALNADPGAGVTVNAAAGTTVSVGAGAVPHFAAINLSEGSTLGNSGTVRYGNNISLAGASIINAGTFEFVDDSGLSTGSGPGAAFSNTGTLLKSGGGGTSVVGSGISFHNAGGVIDVESGTLEMDGPLSIADQSSLTKTGPATLSIPGSFTVGNFATATFNQTAGTVAFGGQLSLASSGNGTYNLSGGTLTAPSLVMSYAGSGALNVSGGALQVSGDIATGLNGPATITQTGGSVVVGGGLYLTVWNFGPTTYDLSGGTLVTGATVIGHTGAATFNQTGGSHITGGLTLGNGGTGVYNISGGSLNAPWINLGYGVGSSGTLVVDGSGTVNVSGNTGLTLNGQGNVLWSRSPDRHIHSERREPFDGSRGCWFSRSRDFHAGRRNPQRERHVDHCGRNGNLRTV